MQGLLSEGGPLNLPIQAGNLKYPSLQISQRGPAKFFMQMHTPVFGSQISLAVPSASQLQTKQLKDKAKPISTQCSDTVTHQF